MSDARLRELERKWKESGAEAAEAAWLQERLRVGQRLDWDGYCRAVQLGVCRGDYPFERGDDPFPEVAEPDRTWLLESFWLHPGCSVFVSAARGHDALDINVYDDLAGLVYRVGRVDRSVEERRQGQT